MSHSWKIVEEPDYPNNERWHVEGEHGVALIAPAKKTRAGADNKLEAKALLRYLEENGIQMEFV